MGWREPEDYMEPTDYGMELDSQEARKERKEWERKVLREETAHRRYQTQKDKALSDIEMLIRDHYAAGGIPFEIILKIDAIVKKALTFPDSPV